MKKPRTVSLKTPFEQQLLICEIPFEDYPRPQLKRNSYICLNGGWELSVEGRSGVTDLGKITVPFPPESRISGIDRITMPDETLMYSRRFVIPDGFLSDKILLHFGACDQYTEVFVNGRSVGKNIGGYLPFSFDITGFAVCGENEIKVCVSDPIDPELPYGKQTMKRGGMWYTNTSGIWQTVWLESVPKNHIEKLRFTSTLDSVHIEVFGGEDKKELSIQTPNGQLNYSFSGDSIDIKIENPTNWTPENPYLYSFTLASGEDFVQSYFALRTVEIKNSRICLNGRPYFFHGLLDQGYFSDGIFTPATPEGYKNDIIQMKACGFNMLRKHIKLEPDLFYYYCDKYGMVVFQDMINSGKYSFFVDTALPTVGLRRGISHRATNRRKEMFYNTSLSIVDTLYNHPSVCYYTVFNEGWGQFSADRCYSDLKAADKTRVWDATSGWFNGSLSDVQSKHIYFMPVKLKKKGGRPLVLSEFGGYSCKIKEHSFNLDKTYGYRYFNDNERFETALIALYDNEIIPCIKNGLDAAVLTQVSDVEDETNGLLTYDRAVLKVDKDKMMALTERLKTAFEETL